MDAGGERREGCWFEGLGVPGLGAGCGARPMTMKTEPFVVNIGPQHPSTHGVFRLRLTLDGERSVAADMVMGSLHRSMEKLAEERSYTQNIPFTDRTDYVAAMTGNLAYGLAVEKLCGIEAPG